MSKEMIEMMKELTDANGVPGNESRVRRVMEKHIAPYADEVTYDRLGSLIAKKSGNENGPKFMIAGHLDEIGFMVTEITDKGFVKFQTLGFWWPHVLLTQRVRIITKKKELLGVIGYKIPAQADMKKMIEIKDMYIDIGAESKEQALEYGIRLGDMIVPDAQFAQLENQKLLLAKAWDNRIGCAIAIEVMKRLKDQQHENVVYGVGNVQEEIGLRGAKTTANLVKPDIMIAVDVSESEDTPGHKGTSEMGKGPVIFMKDVTMIPHRGLFDFVVETAEEEKIPHQIIAIEMGGTDAGSTHVSGDGVPSIAITVPTRYIHSHSSILHYDDVEQTIQLITALIKRLDRQRYDDLLSHV